MVVVVVVVTCCYLLLLVDTCCYLLLLVVTCCYLLLLVVTCCYLLLLLVISTCCRRGLFLLCTFLCTSRGKIVGLGFTSSYSTDGGLPKITGRKGKMVPPCNQRVK